MIVHRVLHEPVLVDEVLGFLRPELGGIFVDCTVGTGGHAEALLRASADAIVIGIDCDAESLEQARQRLAGFGARFQAVHANFKELPKLLERLGVSQMRGALADLGLSSFQLESAHRGFSFAIDSPLDMRMDTSCGLSAAELVNRLGERQLADLIFEYGQERRARKIARAIVAERARRPIETTAQLAKLVAKVIGRWAPRRIHPATRTFQALRIAVNRELEGLDRFISDAISALEPGGRLVIISFHSLEDRIVKRALRLEAGRRPDLNPRVRILTPKPVRPDRSEIERNPRSRSARLRACEKL
jgi:16S rRNA (cytosine1402-N4)-methyltransferase